MDAPLTAPSASSPPADLSPIARYEEATAEGGWLTSDGWLRLADDLDAQADAEYRRGFGIGGRTNLPAFDKYRDRAEDCRQRAAAMRRGAL